jgi:hypothetical protein
MTSMLFVNVESIWNCTSYSFENDDDEKENIVQHHLKKVKDSSSSVHRFRKWIEAQEIKKEKIAEMDWSETVKNEKGNDWASLAPV